MRLRWSVTVLAAALMLAVAPAAGAQPSSIIGGWKGSIKARGIPPWPVTVEVHRLTVGKRSGYMTFPLDKCAGILTLLRRSTRGFVLHYNEVGRGEFCDPGQAYADARLLMRLQDGQLFVRMTQPSPFNRVSEGLLRPSVCGASIRAQQAC